MAKHSKTFLYSSSQFLASLINFPSSPAFPSFIGIRRLSAEDHLSHQFFEHLSWPGLVFPNMFHWETFSVIWLSMKDDRWIINFFPFGSFQHLFRISMSFMKGEHVSAWGLASVTGRSIYQSKDFPITYIDLLLVVACISHHLSLWHCGCL